MLLDGIFVFLRTHWLLALTAVIAAYLLKNKYNRGLRRFPGPRLAAYTDLWRFFDCLNRSPEWSHIRLHRQHGDIVRLGPNVLSFSDPKAIKDIYGLNKGFTKSAFYPVQNAVSKGRRLQSLFSTTDEEYHARYRRCVNSAFAMSSLISYEPLVDSTLNVFLDRTEELFASTSTVCNFGRWLQFFAFDVIGDLTWSKRLGFIETNEDVDGIVAFISRFLSYAGPVGQLPILDLLLEKNFLKMFLARHGLWNTPFPVTAFAQKQSASRATEMLRVKEFGLPKDSESPAAGIDLLTKFTLAAHNHPDFMTDHQILASCTSMVFAGSETTAISLSSIFYHLLKHPDAYRKLVREIDAAVRDGRIVDRPTATVSWAESQTLPYLDAVVQESFRLHPAAGLLLERVVPRQGATVAGTWIPGGTIVGCNAWVLHRREEVFGPDVDAWRPERWLEADPLRLKAMKGAMFQFGAGARTCIGKNVSLMEVYKLVPSFLRRFEIRLDRPDRTWRTHNGWFVRQLDFNTTFKSRARGEMEDATGE